MDKLHLINIFLKVANLGSFTATSTHLGVDPSTISKSIHQLELHLKCRLFIRTTRKLQLSPAGELYRTQCIRLLNELSDCEQQLSQEQTTPQGLLKINLPVAYGQLYIVPLLGKFCKKYPDIKLDVSLTDDYVDMITQSIDIAIRSGKLQDSRLVAKKLSPMDFATCASPQLLKKMPTINSSNIEKMPWVNYRFIHTGKPMQLFALTGKKKCKEPVEINPDISLTTTDGLSMIRAAIEGIGLVQAPHFLLRDAVSSKKLEVVQAYFRSTTFNVYAYYTNKDYLPMKVRVFLDFIVDELNKIGESVESTFLSRL